MDRNCVSDNIEYDPVDDKTTKIQEPTSCSSATTSIRISWNEQSLPRRKRQFTSKHSKWAIRDLQSFFPDDILPNLVNHTNGFPTLQIALQTPQRQPRYPTTVKELWAYIAIYISMGVHPETAVKGFWNRKLEKPIHLSVSKTWILEDGNKSTDIFTSRSLWSLVRSSWYWTTWSHWANICVQNSSCTGNRECFLLWTRQLQDSWVEQVKLSI